MEDVYTSLLQLLQREEHLAGSTVSLPDSEHVEPTSSPGKNTSGIDVWRAVLDRSQQVPKPLREAFLAQVLIFIFDAQPISPATLNRALRRASEAVERVVQARKTGELRRSALERSALSIFDSFGDMAFLVKYRLAAENEEHRNNLVSALLGLTAPRPRTPTALRTQSLVPCSAWAKVT